MSPSSVDNVVLQCAWTSRQSRTRTVLRAPGPAAAPCPPQLESRACVANTSCWSYSWQLTPWTSCQPIGHATCGPGHQRRGARCVRGDGRPVAPRHCAHLEPPGDTQVPCSVDCPVDCQLSAWSAWSAASCGCGAAGRASNLTRSRHIVVSASATGRPCPASLGETKPCPAQPCYTWAASGWSPCQLQVSDTVRRFLYIKILSPVQGAACGTGVMTRNVSCVMADTARVVAAARCLANLSSEQQLVTAAVRAAEAAATETARECYVSCHHDCTVSEWSSWSACQHTTCLPLPSGGGGKNIL